MSDKSTMLRQADEAFVERNARSTV